MSDRKVSKEIKGLSERAKKAQLTFADLIIPLASFIILVILSVFVFFPMLKTANKHRAELTQINEKLNQLDQLEQEILLIDETDLYSNLVTSKEIIPNVLRVSDFVFYIDNLAQEKGLTSREISARDINIGGTQTEIHGSLGVSGPLSYTGEYSKILEFIDEIQEYSPYLVTLRNITLLGRAEDVWTVDFLLSGYYIPERDLQVDFYKDFNAYTKFPNVLEMFSLRVSNRDE